jgi:hypothetical protein
MKLGVLKKYIDNNFEKGFIKLSTSSYTSSILFIPKKNEILRLYIDFRQLNSITVKDCYILFLIKELYNRLRSAQIFTNLDLRRIYNLIRIKESEE